MREANYQIMSGWLLSFEIGKDQHVRLPQFSGWVKILTHATSSILRFAMSALKTEDFW